jgi:hypothetical protein
MKHRINPPPASQRPADKAPAARGRKRNPRKHKDPANSPDLHGRCWTRTSDPYDVSVVLCQLS